MDKQPKQQTLIGLIRSRLREYETRQIEGVTQQTFAEELTREGRKVSYSNFRTLYARAKKQVSQTQSQPQKKEVVEQKLEQTKEDVSIQGTHNPTDLDAIANGESVDINKYFKNVRGKK